MEESRKSIKIMLIPTGGTIEQKHDDQGVAIPSDSRPFAECIEKIKTRLNAHAKRYGETGETYDISEIKLGEMLDENGEKLNKDGSNITPDDWKLLTEKIKKHYEEYDAFVITHGTNTLGYTSSALSFALTNLAKPVILTGAQVSFGYTGSDAQMNLENAIRVAAYKKERFVGVTVVFGSIIITGTRAKKTNEFDYDTFKAFNVLNTIARIGNSVRINEEGLKFHRKSWPLVDEEKIEPLALEDNFEMMKRIVPLTEIPGMDSDLFEHLLRIEDIP